MKTCSCGEKIVDNIPSHMVWYSCRVCQTTGVMGVKKVKRRHKSVFNTEINLGILGTVDAEILYDKDNCLPYSVVIQVGEHDVDIISELESEDHDEFARQIKNHEADLTDYYYEQYRDSLADR